MTGSATELDSDDEIRAELAAQAAAVRRANTSIPVALRGLEFRDLDPSEGRGEIILALQAWSVQGGGLYLLGEPGGGKTRMAATAAWAMLAHRPVAWVPAAAASRALNADFASPDRELLTALGRPVALVLEDLGQEQQSNATRELWHTAIDFRVASGLPLLVTSNLKPSEHGARHGAWLTSRLTGYCRAYRVLGRDRRLTP
jgi:DNA replication protein DnaC